MKVNKWDRLFVIFEQSNSWMKTEQNDGRYRSWLRTRSTRRQTFARDSPPGAVPKKREVILKWKSVHTFIHSFCFSLKRLTSPIECVSEESYYQFWDHTFKYYWKTNIITDYVFRVRHQMFVFCPLKNVELEFLDLFHANKILKSKTKFSVHKTIHKHKLSNCWLFVLKEVWN